jgi:hypothetical protein
MTLDNGETALARPTAIAVYEYCYVLRNGARRGGNYGAFDHEVATKLKQYGKGALFPPDM